MKLKWKFPNQLFEGKLLGLYKNQKLEIAVMHEKKSFNDKNQIHKINNANSKFTKKRDATPKFHKIQIKTSLNVYLMTEMKQISNREYVLIYP